MSAAELRQAAETLRGRAAAEGVWPCGDYIRSGIRHLQRNCEVECDHSEWDEASNKYIENECPSPDGGWDRYTTGTYIATMHPGVGLALADWLDHESTIAAEDEADGYVVGPRYPGLVLARLINGGTHG